ncbi:MAG TPA: hypothetical protein VK973_10265 [Arenicellales bacterium]|nr:hypothetical protein [Arenicellales bacterium]
MGVGSISVSGGVEDSGALDEVSSLPPDGDLDPLSDVLLEGGGEGAGISVALSPASGSGCCCAFSGCCRYGGSPGWKYGERDAV